uniref:Uncharacterized protein n=1 Tax=viral metagenome TaxID=1070528 RepID=A0A6H1ZV27_9ZZZZ
MRTLKELRELSKVLKEVGIVFPYFYEVSWDETEDLRNKMTGFVSAADYNAAIGPSPCGFHDVGACEHFRFVVRDKSEKLCCNCKHFIIQRSLARCDRFIELVDGLFILCIEARNGGSGYPFHDDSDKRTWACNPMGDFYEEKKDIRGVDRDRHRGMPDRRRK